MKMTNNTDQVADQHLSWRSFPLTEVLYRNNDLLSFIFAISSLLPVIIIVFLSGIASAAPLHEPQRESTLILLMFLVINVCVNVCLKHLFAHARPTHSSLSASYSSIHGMPSDHAQFMMFFACYLLRINNVCKSITKDGAESSVAIKESNKETKNETKHLAAYTINAKQTSVTWPMKLFLFGATFFVSYGRVYNEYHTIEQVVGGLVVGYVMSVICTHKVTQNVLRCVVSIVVVPVMLMCTRWTKLLEPLESSKRFQ